MLHILLIISMMTDGFSRTSSIPQISEDIDAIALKTNSEKAFELAEEINTKLDSLKVIVDQAVSEPVGDDDSDSDTDDTDSDTGDDDSDYMGDDIVEVDFDSDSVELQFYVMSQCPYGLQVENGIAPVLEKLGDAVDFKLDFIGNGTVLLEGQVAGIHMVTPFIGLVPFNAVSQDSQVDQVVVISAEMIPPAGSVSFGNVF